MTNTDERSQVPLYPTQPWIREDPQARAAAVCALLWIGGLGSLAGIALALSARRRPLSRADHDRTFVGLAVGTFGVVLSVALVAAALLVPRPDDDTATSAAAAPVTSAPLPVVTTAAARTTAATAAPATAAPATTAQATTAVCPPADGSAPRSTRFGSEPPTCIDTTKSYTAVVTTNFGPLTVALDAKLAPIAVNNFVFLARWKYFDGTTCHRAIPGFMVQCGDPSATGRGGPGYTIKDELPAAGSYKIGSLAMANSGPDTSGSQFFIITGATGERLPASYTLLGQVTTGVADVLPQLDAAGNPDSSANGVPPRQPIAITSVTISEQ